MLSDSMDHNTKANVTYKNTNVNRQNNAVDEIISRGKNFV